MFDKLGEVLVKGVTSAFQPSTLIPAALSFLGGERRNRQQAASADAANQFSAQQFATRYQTTMKDMQAAGLNPMLAYQQGGGNAPSGQQAIYQDTLSPAVSAYQAERLQRTQADLNTSSAARADQEITVMESTIKKIDKETRNLDDIQAQLRAIVENLTEQNSNLRKQGANLDKQNEVMTKTIEKMGSEIKNIDFQALVNKAEGTLRGFDVKAATDLGNLGRNSAQVKTVLDALITILRK
jgi:hypothetical protein